MPRPTPAAPAPPPVRPVRVARLAAAALLLLGAPAAGAQEVVRTAPDSTVARGTMTLVGTVTDGAGTPLLGAEASVDERRRTALSDAGGAFVLRGLPAGRVHLWVRRIGHRPVSFDVTAAAGTRVEVAVRMTPTALRLAEVIVEGKAYDQALWDAGFYRRERMTRGRFLDGDYMANFGGAGVSTLLRDTPRVLLERQGTEYFAYSSRAGGRCRMNVFVDGRLAREALPGTTGDPGIGIDQVVPRDLIHAMEIYPTIAAVPTQFQRIGPDNRQLTRGSPRLPFRGASRGRGERPPDGAGDAACGAIVIWTTAYAARRQAAGTP